MAKRHSEALHTNATPEHPSTPKSRTPSRPKNIRGDSRLPENISALRAERTAETEEVSGIRKRIGGERMPTPGADAVLAIEHAKSSFESGTIDPAELHRVQSELLTSKRRLETVVSTMRARGADQNVINEYFEYLTEIERLLEIAERTRPEEIEEAYVRSEMVANEATRETKLASTMHDIAEAKRREAASIEMEISKAEAELEDALLDRGVTDARSEERRLSEVYDNGGWSVWKERLSDAFRGGPSVSKIYARIRNLRTQRDALNVEVLDAQRLAKPSPEKGEAPTPGTTRRRPATSQAELRREAERREARDEAEALYGRAKEKTPKELEAEYLGEQTEEKLPEYDVDLSDLEEEEPLPLTRKKKKLPAPTLQKDTQSFAAKETKRTDKNRTMEVQRKEIFNTISTREAETVMPSAHLLWNAVNEKLLGRKKQDLSEFAQKVDPWQKTGDMPQTKFVIEAARLKKARDLGANEQTIAIIQHRLQDVAEFLGVENNLVYRRSTDPMFNEAMNLVPHADQFIELIHKETGVAKDDENVSETARNYLTALGAYRKAVHAGDVDAQNAAWQAVREMNDVLGIRSNALVQSVIGTLERPKSVLKGVRQRQLNTQRANQRSKF